ncbi:MAG: thioredoxin [Acidobacteria bacterium]|nr:MAG: thioredoxin [Acidobacteriota bacterium]
MLRKIFLISLVAIMAVGTVAIARYPHRRNSSVFLNSPSSRDKPIALADIKTDMLIPAGSAPVAPAFAEGKWINSDPLTIEKLRGRVLLVEFWTFGCYNCRNTLPSVKEWDQQFRDRGLTIIGVHTPELSEEYDLDNLRREVPSLGIKYAVVTDNDYKTWKAYNLEAWPTIFVIDKQGRIRWQHVGEGRYEETESVIKELLAE